MADDFSIPIFQSDATYILNHCAKYLARDNSDGRHNFGQFAAGNSRANICESYHFPIIDSFYDGQDQTASYGFNRITFVYFNKMALPQAVFVLGSFAQLHERIPMQPVLFGDEETGYYSVTCVIPKGEVHTYKYLVDGNIQLDAINPQQAKLDNGEFWSRFFTQLCTTPLVFERYEWQLLERLADHILPFHTKDGGIFLRNFYNFLDQQAKQTQFLHAYRLDQSVGIVNFIDKLLAREESHNLDDYKICLKQIDRVLRQRNPFMESALMSKEVFIQLYNEMASGNVMDWNYNLYSNPKFFLQLLRRHVFTGAFSHPKYGGNVGGIGWAYLAERLADGNGDTLFNWRLAIEQPLGVNAEYRG